MINRMILSNLAHRPLRTALSMIAVAVEVLLIISVVGLVTGLLEEAASRQRGIGADIIVQPPGSSVLMAMSTGSMPVKVGDRLAQVNGVTAVAPVFVQSFGGLTVAYGVDDRFNEVTGGFHVLQGRIIQNGFELMVDDIYARDNKLGVGSKQTLFNNEFEVVGVVERGKGARLFIPLAIMQELLGAPQKATLFYLKLADRGADLRVKADLLKLLEGYTIRTMEEYTSLITAGNLPGLKPFQRIMIGIAVVIGFLVIFLAMYTTVLERTREVGILKSLGASKAYIVNIILRETVIVAAVGIAVGIVASILLRHFVLRSFPQLSILITPAWLAWASLIAVAGAMLGAFYPALRAARQDPIAALAYE